MSARSLSPVDWLTFAVPIGWLLAFLALPLLGVAALSFHDVADSIPPVAPLLSRSGEHTVLQALPVNMLSSHGAGDCFCGALAARLAHDDDLVSACDYARTAAGLYVAMTEARQPELSDKMVRERMK